MIAQLAVSAVEVGAAAVLCPTLVLGREVTRKKQRTSMWVTEEILDAPREISPVLSQVAVFSASCFPSLCCSGCSQGFPLHCHMIAEQVWVAWVALEMVVW